MKALQNLFILTTIMLLPFYFCFVSFFFLWFFTRLCSFYGMRWKMAPQQLLSFSSVVFFSLFFSSFFVLFCFVLFFCACVARRRPFSCRRRHYFRCKHRRRIKKNSVIRNRNSVKLGWKPSKTQTKKKTEKPEATGWTTERKRDQTR